MSIDKERVVVADQTEARTGCGCLTATLMTVAGPVAIWLGSVVAEKTGIPLTPFICVGVPTTLVGIYGLVSSLRALLLERKLDKDLEGSTDWIKDL